MNSIVSIVLALALCFLMVVAQAAEPLKIGLSLWNDNKPSNKALIASFIKASKRLNFTPIVMGSDNKHEVQFKNIHKMLSQGVSGIIFQPIDPNQAPSFLDSCLTRNIQVVALEVDVIHSAVVGFVSPNYKKVGVIQAQRAIKSRGESGHFLLLGGEKGHPLVESIFDGANSVLKNYKLIKEERFYLKSWSTNEAEETILKKIKDGTTPSAILTVSDGLLHGAVKAIYPKRGKRTNIFIASFGLSVGIVNSLIYGRQDITIIPNFEEMIGRSLKRVLDKKAKTKSTDLVDVEVIETNKDIVKKVFDRELLTRKEVFSY